MNSFPLSRLDVFSCCFLFFFPSVFVFVFEADSQSAAHTSLEITMAAQAGHNTQLVTRGFVVVAAAILFFKNSVSILKSGRQCPILFKMVFPLSYLDLQST